MKTALALLPLLLVAAPAPEAEGPPCICFQLDIGEQVSLPWGKGPFAVDQDYERAQVVGDTGTLLRGSEDPVYRIETVRRAVIYLTGVGSGDRRKGSEVRPDRAALLAMLRRDALARLADPEATAESRATGWLTVGFAQAAFDQAGFAESRETADRNGADALEAALRLRPDDPYVAFGAGLGLFLEDRAASYRAFDRAAAAAEEDPRLRALMEETVASFVGERDFPSLRQRLRDEVDQQKDRAALERR